MTKIILIIIKNKIIVKIMKIKIIKIVKIIKIIILKIKIII